MNFFQKFSPEWLLRAGLGLMYLYSGYDLLVKPHHWYGFVPKWFSQTVTPLLSIDSYLQLQGIGELLLGILFLSWFLGKRWLRAASFLAVLEMALILVLIGIDPITFRDIGLLGGALALFIISGRGPRVYPWLNASPERAKRAEEII